MQAIGVVIFASAEIAYVSYVPTGISLTTGGRWEQMGALNMTLEGANGTTPILAKVLAHVNPNIT